MTIDGNSPKEFTQEHASLLKKDDVLIRDKFMEIFGAHYGDKLLDIVKQLFSDGVMWEDTEDYKYLDSISKTVETLQPTDLILVRDQNYVLYIIFFYIIILVYVGRYI